LKLIRRKENSGKKTLGREGVLLKKDLLDSTRESIVGLRALRILKRGTVGYDAYPLKGGYRPNRDRERKLLIEGTRG